MYIFVNLVIASPLQLNTIETQLWSYIVGPIAKLCMCQLGPVKIPGGSRRGHSWKKVTPLSSHKIGFGKLVCDKKCLLYKPNALEWSKRLCEKVLLLSVPFGSKTFDAFGIFSRFRSLYTYNGYNKFDWLTLILRSNWTCRIWFGILSSRAFCIVSQILFIFYRFQIIALWNIQRPYIEPT